MFKLPELTYPLSIDTLGKLMAVGSEMTIHCHTNGCRHHGRINLVMLARKLGMDHGCLDDDLRRYFYCPKCREAGRPDRNFSFRSHALTDKVSDWPRKLSAYERAKGL
jgi:hypothetical protein